MSSTTVVTDWAERTAQLHRVMMPQKDNLCGAFWGAIVLPAAGIEHADQDLVALESDTLLRTEDEIVDEVMRELGFRRRGPRIQAVVLAALREARGEAPPSA